jgi:hypothetical protein
MRVEGKLAGLLLLVAAQPHVGAAAPPAVGTPPACEMQVRRAWQPAAAPSALHLRLRGGDGDDEAKKSFNLDAFKVKSRTCDPCSCTSDAHQMRLRIHKCITWHTHARMGHGRPAPARSLAAPPSPLSSAVQRLYSNTDDTASIMPQFWTDFEAEEVHHCKACLHARSQNTPTICGRALASLPR